MGIRNTIPGLGAWSREAVSKSFPVSVSSPPFSPLSLLKQFNSKARAKPSRQGNGVGTQWDTEEFMETASFNAGHWSPGRVNGRQDNIPVAEGGRNTMNIDTIKGSHRQQAAFSSMQHGVLCHRRHSLHRGGPFLPRGYQSVEAAEYKGWVPERLIKAFMQETGSCTGLTLEARAL